MNEFDDDDNSVVEHKNRSQTRQEWEIQKKNIFVQQVHNLYLDRIRNSIKKKKREKNLFCLSFIRSEIW